MPSARVRAHREDGPGVRVLLVLDYAPDRLNVVSEYIQRERDLVLVGAISTDQEALARVGELRPQVAVIGGSREGLEAMRMLRRTMPGIGIIALATPTDLSHRRAVFEAGADDLVRRKEMSEDLLPSIRRLAEA